MYGAGCVLRFALSRQPWVFTARKGQCMRRVSGTCWPNRRRLSPHQPGPNADSHGRWISFGCRLLHAVCRFQEYFGWRRILGLSFCPFNIDERRRQVDFFQYLLGWHIPALLFASGLAQFPSCFHVLKRGHFASHGCTVIVAGVARGMPEIKLTLPVSATRSPGEALTAFAREST